MWLGITPPNHCILLHPDLANYCQKLIYYTVYAQSVQVTFPMKTLSKPLCDFCSVTSRKDLSVH